MDSNREVPGWALQDLNHGQTAEIKDFRPSSLTRSPYGPARPRHRTEAKGRDQPVEAPVKETTNPTRTPTVPDSCWFEQTMSNLEPISPTQAVALYEKDILTDRAEWTRYSHKSRLGHFVRWCDKEDVDNLNTLTGRDLHRYRLWRRDDGDLNKVTVKTQMDTLRVFVRWCESIDAVEADLSEKVQSPNVDGENSRDEMLDADRAQAILQYLRRYQYASVEHVTMTLAWRCGMRIGALHALDLDDYSSADEYLEITHRPDTETPLKNKDDGNRHVAISADTVLLLDDYVEHHRHDVTDDNGRTPLLTTAQGRPHTTTIRAWIYRSTRPCAVGQDCPHDRDKADCDATDNQSAYACPSSVSAHPVRRGAITHWLREDIPEQVVSDRMNVSGDVIEEHYDQRTGQEKMEQRRSYLDNV